MSYRDVNTYGHEYRKARVAHTCWGCGKTIAPGEKYWRCVAVTAFSATTIKTCRDKCETIVDMIDQNQSAMSQAVFQPTLADALGAKP